MIFIKNTVLFFAFMGTYYFGFSQGVDSIRTGAEQTEKYIPLLKGKSVGLVGNHNSVIKSRKGYVHLVDSLLNWGISIKKVFGPEHGFRGNAPDGEIIEDEKDRKTGIPIVSLYGKNKKPSQEQLAGLDVLVFDMQSVGVRFYTYLSTLHLILEACADASVPVILLDRPNPNAYYVDGPVLEMEFSSFVGKHPIPIVYGLTLGEMADMIIGEGWLETDNKVALNVIPLQNYSRQEGIELPFAPSPNLPNAQAVALYPSLCLLEPTSVSIGRGTSMQFQVYGHPDFKTDFSFTPQPNLGSKYPKLEGEKCMGVDLRTATRPRSIRLQYLLEAYHASTDKEHFFLKSFERIVGNNQMRKQLQSGFNEEQIRASWEPKLSQFKKLRKKYLRYPDE